MAQIGEVVVKVSLEYEPALDALLRIAEVAKPEAVRGKTSQDRLTEIYRIVADCIVNENIRIKGAKNV